MTTSVFKSFGVGRIPSITFFYGMTLSAKTSKKSMGSFPRGSTILKGKSASSTVV
jgi:hypothetical protein